MLVLHAPDARRRSRVVACCQAAAECGVRSGMPLAEVEALAHLAAIERHDADADRAALQRLALWCERFSPLVGLEENTAPANNVHGNTIPESLLLDISGVAHLFGNEEKLARRLKRELLRQGYRARIAVADTVGAAWGLAHFAATACVVSPPKSAAALLALPIETLRLPEETVEMLRQLGATRIEHVQQLPRAGLTARFGTILPQRLEQLIGARGELIAPHRPLPDFQAAWALEAPTGRRQTVQHVLARLVERLTRELAAHARGALQLECRLHCVGQPSVAVRVSMFRPTAAAAHVMELVRMQLETLTFPAEVEKVSAAVVQSAPLAPRQHQLFTDRRRDDPQQLGLLVDRLSSRLGRQRVVRPQLQAGAQPERTYRLIPLTGAPRQTRTRAARSLARSAASGPSAALPRPLRLLHPPRPVAMVCVAPDGPPARFDDQGRRRNVARHWGPERIETAWWRGASVRRDYYRVECTDGYQFWLFRRLSEDRWFLHGAFD